MYNDYYLEQINNKLSTSNDNLIEIIENQEAIIQNQEIQISGDNQIIKHLQYQNSCIIGVQIGLIIGILYTFVRGCFRC